MRFEPGESVQVLLKDGIHPRSARIQAVYPHRLYSSDDPYRSDQECWDLFYSVRVDGITFSDYDETRIQRVF